MVCGGAEATDKQGKIAFFCKPGANTHTNTRNFSAVGTPTKAPLQLLPREAGRFDGPMPPRRWGSFVLGDTEPHTPPGGTLEAPCAFNDQRFAVVLQFIAHIAFCRGLPQCTSQEIHCEVPYGKKKWWRADPNPQGKGEGHLLDQNTTLLILILLQVHLQQPCYDFCFL